MIDFSKLLDIVKDPDLKLKISELVSENLQLKEENFKLKQDLQKLQNQSDIAERLSYENDVYYLENDGAKEGPYCSKCWESDKKLIRMHSFSNGFNCPNCQTTVYNK